MWGGQGREESGLWRHGMGMVHIIHGIPQGEWVVQNVDDYGDLEEVPKWSRRYTRG